MFEMLTQLDVVYVLIAIGLLCAVVSLIWSYCERRDNTALKERIAVEERETEYWTARWTTAAQARAKAEAQNREHIDKIQNLEEQLQFAESELSSIKAHI